MMAMKCLYRHRVIQFGEILYILQEENRCSMFAMRRQTGIRDIDDIRSKITSRTKAIVVINPNNPTGMLYPREILEQIVEVAREAGIMVFADEIYDRLVMDGLEHTSIGSLADDVPMVTLNGLSKSHCLCGYRCGWMIISGPRALTEDYKQGIVQLTSLRLCANTLGQIVIPAALDDMETPMSMVRPGGRIIRAERSNDREA